MIADMSIKASANICLSFATEKQLETLISALIPEVKVPPTRRANIIIQKQDFFLTLKVEACDTVALRATLNAYLRWIKTTLDIMDVVK